MGVCAILHRRMRSHGIALCNLFGVAMDDGDGLVSIMWSGLESHFGLYNRVCCGFGREYVAYSAVYIQRKTERKARRRLLIEPCD